MALDLSEIVYDPDIGKAFSIIRNTGTFVLGGWEVTSTKNLCAWGVFNIAEGKALDMVPEADRVKGAIQVLCGKPMYPTSEWRDGTSDQVSFDGNLYRVMSSEPWVHDGFWNTILVRIKGS